MTIHQLNNRNFSLAGRGNIKDLNINIPGLVLVLFKQDNCQGCSNFEPIFLQLTRDESSINYGIVNVSVYKDVIRMSRETRDPIKMSPTLILFNNGVSYAVYTGRKAYNEVKSFINKIKNILSSPQYQPQQYQPPYGGMMYGPQKGQAGYSGEYMASQPGRPPIQPPHHVKNIPKGPNTPYYVNDDDDGQLLMPADIIPYNTPWETTKSSEY